MQIIDGGMLFILVWAQFALHNPSLCVGLDWVWLARFGFGLGHGRDHHVVVSAGQAVPAAEPI